jgi:hypothetical protein
MWLVDPMWFIGKILHCLTEKHRLFSAPRRRCGKLPEGWGRCDDFSERGGRLILCNSIVRFWVIIQRKLERRKFAQESGWQVIDSKGLSQRGWTLRLGREKEFYLTRIPGAQSWLVSSRWLRRILFGG